MDPVLKNSELARALRNTCQNVPQARQTGVIPQRAWPSPGPAGPAWRETVGRDPGSDPVWGPRKWSWARAQKGVRFSDFQKV